MFVFRLVFSCALLLAGSSPLFAKTQPEAPATKASPSTTKDTTDTANETPEEVTDAPATSAMDDAQTGEPDAAAMPSAQDTSGDASPPSAPKGEVVKIPSEVPLKEWTKDIWAVLAPKTALFELDGYFRMRGYMLRKLDFGNQSVWETGGRYPTTNVKSATSRRADFSSADMRLRLEPKINISDMLQVVTTLDILDNLVLGSTPTTIPPGTATPLNVLNRSQEPPHKGFNSLSDSIVVRRAYARIMLLNEQIEVRAGRMPDHFGLGMFANSGDCLDCDFGHVADRVAVTFKLFNHMFVPMFDWVSTGPTIMPFGRGQALDAAVWDDAVQYGLRAMREDHPEDIQSRVAKGQLVVNYGMWHALRTQARDLAPTTYGSDPNNPKYTPDIQVGTNVGNDQRRNALIYMGDAYGRLYYGQIELAMEAAVVAGSFKDTGVDPNTLMKSKVLQWAAAFEGKYRMKGDLKGLLIGFKSGIASGDKRPGYGALNKADSQRGSTGAVGSQAAKVDAELSNFQFSPDYHVDLLMFRRIVGAVTDAWYIRPEASYSFENNVMGKLAMIYSQSIYSTSTAACFPGDDGVSPCTTNPAFRARAMGLEVDGELSYGTAQAAGTTGFRAALLGGIAFPFGAFKNHRGLDGPGTTMNGSFAWTLQGRLYLTF